MMHQIMSRQQLTAARLYPGVRALDRAEGVLIGLRCCSCTDAFDELLEAARRQHVPVFTIASALVDLACGSNQSIDDPAALIAAESLWGDLFRSRRQVDHPQCNIEAQ